MSSYRPIDVEAAVEAGSGMDVLSGVDRDSSSFPCFNGAADPNYVQNVKLFLQTVELSMFNGPEHFQKGLTDIQNLVASQLNDIDNYRLTVNLVKQYGNGRFSHFELPKPDLTPR